MRVFGAFFVLVSLVLVGCTPEQLRVWEEVTGDPLPQSVLELPDVPLRLPDGREIAVDGSVSAVPVAPAGSKCGEFFGVALAAGWTVDQWPKLDHIIWRESRCNPQVHNPKGRDDSYGLTQINLRAHRTWVRPIVNSDWTQLFDPATNLRVAHTLYQMARDTYGCGFQPWKTTKQKHWCN